jgi:hypothetical protein
MTFWQAFWSVFGLFGFYTVLAIAHTKIDHGIKAKLGFSSGYVWIALFVVIFFAFSLYIGDRSRGLNPDYNLNAILSDPSMILLAFTFGLMFYWLRGVQPFVFGILEILVGVGTIWFASSIVTTDTLSKLLGELGGIYIIVRGFDNADRGLPNGLRETWDYTFPKRTKSASTFPPKK